ncbi:hypothetical protein [Aquimarina sediminis]|uniref:hypothetical protein n=1 Tax=Aquimarina sediminis TaxID=2070536 RepID=UPI000CA01ACE|nr:hypothetical protein [Aquimarina sediminis]
MKYNQFYNKERKVKNDLVANAFGSILEMGLYTWVVNPLQEMITDIIGYKRLETMFRFIYKKPNENVITFSYTSHKACIS